METLDLVFLGMVVNLVLTVIGNKIGKKYPDEKELYMKIITVVMCLVIALVYYLSGEGIVKPFITITGVASALYGLFTKDNKTINRYLS
ncbi:MAG: hypothetical protein WCX46_04620 [Candidatus Paceibacterota bacterium]